MSMLSRLLRRVRALWSALTRSLRAAPADPPSLPPAAPPAPSRAALEGAIETVSSDMSMSAAPAASLTGAAASVVSGMSLSAAPRASLAAVAPDMSLGAGAPAPAAPRGEAVVAATAVEGSVRQFFARVAAAAPGGLVVDFAAWQGVKVERFFMAIHAPERAQRRGPAIADEPALGGAFEGFQWD